MWKGLVEWASEQMLRPGFELASAEDMQIPRCVDDAEQAVAVIREHHARWLALVASRKLKLSIAEIREVLATIRAVCRVEPLSEATPDMGLQVSERDGLSIYDAMIVALALLASCGILVSEDLQDRQDFQGKTGSSKSLSLKEASMGRKDRRIRLYVDVRPGRKVVRLDHPPATHRLVDVHQCLEEIALIASVVELREEKASLGIEHLEKAGIAVVVAQPGESRIALEGGYPTRLAR